MKNSVKAYSVIVLSMLFFLPSVVLASILVDVEWLKKHQSDPDIRIVGVYKKGKSFGKEHIPGSVQIDRSKDLRDHYAYPPMDLPPKAQFEAVMNRAGIDNNTTVVIYDESYQFASKLFYVMEYFGHDIDKLKILDGGLTAWKAAGEPVSSKRIKVENKNSYSAKAPNMDIVATRGDIRAHIHKTRSKNNVLMDSRTKKEWTGKKIRGIRTGHIPKAIHHEAAAEFMEKESHKFRKDIDNLVATLEAKGISKDNNVYTYCHGGARAPHAYVVMKHLLGYPNVKVYVQGWNEWNNLTALPVAGGKFVFNK